MDFFAQQDIARRNTRLLAALFVVAVFLLILLTNAALAAFLYFNQDYNIYSGSREGVDGFLSYFSFARFGSVGGGVSAIVGLVVLVNWIRLSTGGKTVAERLGGTRILPQTRNADERRCLNVVEEMSLAANMPVPAVYVLDSERGINAFAAGITPADAVVAVTRGAIVHLKRHELQGVIAHEFSHILNGDMRLNVRLAAMLKGITFVGDVGHILLRSGHSPRSGKGSNSGAALPILGLAFTVLGWIGGLAAGFIKAAISRQKEFLADASAVQYTRSSDGIGDALKVIGGYVPGTLVHAARAMEMSHIFFGQIEHRLWQVFATHPPLADRISRVDPSWNGQYIERKTIHYATEPTRPGSGEVGVGRAALVAAAMAGALDDNDQLDFSAQPDAQFTEDPDALDEQTSLREEVPLVLVQYSHEPLGAQAIVHCLLLHSVDSVREQQLSLVGAAGVQGLEEMVVTLHPGIDQLGAPHRLPLLEMCLPALKAMSTPQYRQFKSLVLSLVHTDQKVDLYEWCLFQLLRHYLDPEFISVKPSRPLYQSLQKVAYYLRTVLSVLAYEDSSDATAAFRLGAEELDMGNLQILPRDQASVSAFSKAVHELGNCYPLLKPRILKAMASTAAADGELTPQEREIIASMAAVMDCPSPDLL